MLQSLAFTILAATSTNNQTLYNAQLLVLLLVITLAVALISQPLRLPYTLVLVVVGLAIGFSPLLPDLHLEPDIVLFLFLPILLFEGAWNVDVKYLRADWLPIILLAIPGLLLSLFVVAALLQWGIGLSWLLALLLGAIISPTDPVAVIALLRQLGLPDRLRTIIEGESLFNDGVGAAAFELVLGFLLISLSPAAHEATPSIFSTILQAFWLMLGGLIIGVGVGLIVARLLRAVDNHLVETTITVCVAYGVYLLAVMVQTSGLLAVVGAGLVLGSYGQRVGLSKRARQATKEVWGFLSYLINSLIFLLLGVQIGESHVLQALPGVGLALVGVIIGRALMIYLLLPLQNAIARRVNRHEQPKSSFFPRPLPLPSHWHPIFLLSGLRGALSIALVLSLPAKLPKRDLLEVIVYGVVLVTLLGQGVGLRLLLPHWKAKHE